MYTGLDITLIVLSCAINFLVGWMACFLFIEISRDKKLKRDEQEKKQQQMWTEYLEALKGGQNAK